MLEQFHTVCRKIVELTGMDFDNVAEILAVRNGIIILKILELL